MKDPLLRFHSLRLRTNPFEVVETAVLMDIIPEPRGLAELLAGDWKAVEIVGPSGSGKTTRLHFALRMLRRRGVPVLHARLGGDGAWQLSGDQEAARAIALDELDRDGRTPRPGGLPARAREPGVQVLLAASRPQAARLGLQPCRTVILDRLETDEIQAYYRARIEAVSTGPAGRYEMTGAALHRLRMLSEDNFYRLQRILYQCFEGMVRDEKVEEKSIERGYGAFLLEEQESAEARGRPPVLK